MTAPTILIMAGGTGGHVFPALACARELMARGLRVEWLGSVRGIENELIPQAGIQLHRIPVAGLRGKNLLTLLLAPWHLVKALFAAYKVIDQIKPVCLLGMGGFAAGPGGLVAWLMRRPLIIHEQNAVAGTTNRLLARLSERVLSAYSNVLPHAEVVGNPVRKDISQLSKPAQRFASRTDALRILILGGSLGAAAINAVLPKTVALLSNKLLSKNLRLEIRHQAGRQHAETVQQAYRAENIVADVQPFISDMAEAYGWADVVICRAGALTMAELSAAGVGAICIPYPHAIDDHQTENARCFTEKGAGVLLPQTELSVDRLVALLETNSSRETLLAWAEAARSLAKIDATDRVASICMEAAFLYQAKQES
jgi:UDP-N-acetylglucosamine--N-acetylmuramyl-(pentapeptide) pyrophosphoryl-undecaprenol N-acetylglucosamine transferase